jgi:hypothetical protein
MPLILLGVLGLIALLVWSVIAHAKRERIRLAQLRAWARLNQLSFDKDDRFNLDGRFHGIGNIGDGHSRYAFEVMHGQAPIELWLFRYHYATTETRTVTRNGRSQTETYEQDHWRQYLIAELPGQFPSLDLRPEGVFNKIKELIGFDDINFESEAFSRKYFVKSGNRQFASAVIHPEMMEWLLPRKITLWLRGNRVIMETSGYGTTAHSWCAALAVAGGFVDRIPEFVWNDYAQTPSARIPAPLPPLPIDPDRA